MPEVLLGAGLAVLLAGTHHLEALQGLRALLMVWSTLACWKGLWKVSLPSRGLGLQDLQRVPPKPSCSVIQWGLHPAPQATS